MCRLENTDFPLEIHSFLSYMDNFSILSDNSQIRIAVGG